MSKKVKGKDHPETTGGRAGRAPGRDTKAGQARDKYGERPTMPGRPKTWLKPPVRPKDLKNKDKKKDKKKKEEE